MIVVPSGSITAPKMHHDQRLAGLFVCAFSPALMAVSAASTAQAVASSRFPESPLTWKAGDGPCGRHGLQAICMKHPESLTWTGMSLCMLDRPACSKLFHVVHLNGEQARMLANICWTCAILTWNWAITKQLCDAKPPTFPSLSCDSECLESQLQKLGPLGVMQLFQYTTFTQTSIHRCIY